MLHYPKGLFLEALLLYLVSKDCSCSSQEKAAYDPCMMIMNTLPIYTQTKVK